MSRIKAIDKESIHRICSGQVILDLSTAVKELVENSLDAQASKIDILFKNHGESLIEISDNGFGIDKKDYKFIALKHFTSKLRDFGDLANVTSFGFRGEALSSLCALCSLSITTRCEGEPMGTALTFSQEGELISESSIARTVGTTISIRDLFKPLPVRYKTFIKNTKREFGKMLALLKAYAIICTQVRMTCRHQAEKSTSTIFSTHASDLKTNVCTLFGSKESNKLLPVMLDFSTLISTDSEPKVYVMDGLISKLAPQCGRSVSDRQFFFINRRPVDLPKLSKGIFEYKNCYSFFFLLLALFTFHSSGSVFVLNLTFTRVSLLLSH
jgi:DNA mismatch repair protein PMS2